VPEVEGLETEDCEPAGCDTVTDDDLDEVVPEELREEDDDTVAVMLLLGEEFVLVVLVVCLGVEVDVVVLEETAELFLSLTWLFLPAVCPLPEADTELREEADSFLKEVDALLREEVDALREVVEEDDDDLLVFCASRLYDTEIMASAIIIEARRKVKFFIALNIYW